MVLHATAFSSCIYDDFSFRFFSALFFFFFFLFVLFVVSLFEGVGVIARLRGKERTKL